MYITKEELETSLDKLARISFKVKSFTEYRYVVVCYQLLSELYMNTFFEKPKKHILRNVYYDNIWRSKNESMYDTYSEEYFENKSFNNKLSKNILNTYNKYNYYEINRLNSQKLLSTKEYLEIINSFLSDYNKKMLDYSNYLIKNKFVSDELIFSQNSGETNNIFEINKQYIVVNEPYTVEGMATYLHELAHAYIFNVLTTRSKIQQYNADRSFQEFYSSYIERLFNNYLIKNHIYIKDAIISENNYLRILQCFMNDLKECNDIDINDILVEEEDFIYGTMLYSYGLYLGLIKGTEDIDENKERINDFISYIGLFSKEKELEILGITKEELMSCKKLTKVLIEHKKRVREI